MLSLNCLVFATVLIYNLQTIECWIPSTNHSYYGSYPGLFTKDAYFKLSQTYNDVVAITLQCISNGNTYRLDKAFYADTHFTFKQSDGTISGKFHHVYTSEHISNGTWEADSNKGIQLSSVNVISYWNSILCDVITLTTDSTLIQHSVVVNENNTIQLKCPEDSGVLTIDDAVYSSNYQSNCSTNVRDIVTELCNSTINSKECTFHVSNEHFKEDPCLHRLKQINIRYTCTRSNCINGNCSKVWSEPIAEKISLVTNNLLNNNGSRWNSKDDSDSESEETDSDSISNFKTISDSNPQWNTESSSMLRVVLYREEIIKLQNDQHVMESKLKTHKQILQDYYNLIAEEIIPTLELLCSNINSLNNHQACNRKVQSFMQRHKKSLDIYKFQSMDLE
ncbi:unnamed protein product [Rotaria sordida]|uniref:SUEL-type lectin domain-containing protein n=1 Tax=Rotaria sordida TaxID=392033 RepID=A0A815MXA5_9BILA|nr:unnamed protein product [Rotaria sordida]